MAYENHEALQKEQNCMKFLLVLCQSSKLKKLDRQQQALEGFLSKTLYTQLQELYEYWLHPSTQCAH